MSTAILASGAASSSQISYVAALPSNAAPEAMKLDSAGNIYAAEYLTPAQVANSPVGDGLIAKLSPGGSSQMYLTDVGPVSQAQVALAVDAMGAAYFAGTTADPNLRVLRV